MGKQYQSHYFSREQPHLKVVMSNYTWKVAGKVFDRLGLRGGDSLLEVGCGSGRFTVPLLARGIKVTGVDFSQALVRQLASHGQRDLRIIESDIDELSSNMYERFSVACGFFVLHHLEDLHTSVRSLSKVLRKPARVAFVEPNPFNPQFYVQPFVAKNMSWKAEKGFLDMRKSKLANVFHEAHFSNFSIDTFGFFPPFIVNTSLGFKMEIFLSTNVAYGHSCRSILCTQN